MSLKQTVEADIKKAMLAKEKTKLTALRAFKTAIMTAETEKGSGGSIDEAKELSVLKKLIKQREDVAEVYISNDRKELAEAELEEAKILSAYLPEQMSDEDVKAKVLEIIAETGAESMKDMGKVMGRATKELAGKADGKLISDIVKSQLS